MTSKRFRRMIGFGIFFIDGLTLLGPLTAVYHAAKSAISLKFLIQLFATSLSLVCIMCPPDFFLNLEIWSKKI